MDHDDERAGTLWTLHVLPDSALELYVSCLLGAAFGTEHTTISESYADEKMAPEQLAAARDLYTELAPRFPPLPATRAFRGLPIRIESRLHITHVLDAWANHPPAHMVQLTREIIGGAERGPLRVDVEIGALTSTGRRAIHVLDEFALAQSRRFIDAHGARLVGQPVPDAAPPRPWKIFISYRHLDRDVARQLHRAFVAYGGGAFFDPYLDEHDLGAGALERRIDEAVDASDLLVAVALEEYAAPETWSRRELERAQDRDALIVPVVVGDKRPRHWPEWNRYVAYRFPDAAAITEPSGDVGSLANMMLIGLRERASR